MTIAVITLAAALALAIAGLIAAFVSRARLADALDEARAREVAEQRRGDELEQQRDAVLIAKSKAIALADEAMRRLSAAELARNEATTRESEYVAEQIRTAPDAVAAANRVLQAARNRRAAAGPTGAGGGGDGEAAAVPAAVAPGDPADVGKH